MKRTIYHDLIKWKNSEDRKPLMVYGARQVGKTYIIKKFGENEYDNMVYINCYKNEAIRQLFNSTIQINEILLGLSSLTGQHIQPRNTLIFFDEVQEIPEVVASLKYFCEDAPDYNVIVAGSLLGVLNLENISFPTGKVNMIHMYPMTFKEFLDAMGESGKNSLLEERRFQLIDTLAVEYVKLLRKYYFVGGMPEVVASFISDNNPEKVRTIQNEIINSYYADIAKHAGRSTSRCRMVFDSIPAFLAKENKKFVFGAVQKGARAADFETAIQWLVDAGLVYKVKRTRKVAIPLSFYTDNDSFKLFLLDVGLLGALADVPMETSLVSSNLFSEYKGAFTENYVMTQLVTSIPAKSIAYYKKENSQVEIDFVVQKEDKLFPIEVKAEENVRSKSLRQFITVDYADAGLKGIRFSMKGFADQDWMENIPLYAIDSLLK